ncbi:MAG: hypothetical protein CR988_05325 [Treponema sp.]|nr:MAG: hypothetical protein CR988_05325 [Treponema sp.]
MKTKKFGIGAVLGFAILAIGLFAFIFAPVLSAKGSAQGKAWTYASWDGKKVVDGPGSNLWAQLTSLSRLTSAFGMKPPTDPAQKQYWDYNFRKVAIDATIVDIAMETAVEDAGYKPSKKLINNAIIQQFIDPSTGNYSKALYDRQYKTEADKLQNRKDTIQNLKRARYIKDIMGFGEDRYGLKTNSKEKQFIETMNTETRRVEYIFFDTLDFPNEKILEYANASKDLFVKHDFSVIQFSDESAANNVSSAIKKGETSFDKAFENRDKAPKDLNVTEDGTLANSYRKDLNLLFPNAEDLNTVIGLKPSQISKPLKMNSIFVIIKCNSEPVQPDFQNKELVDMVFSYMQKYEKGKIEDYLLEKANKFAESAKAGSFADAAIEYSVEPMTSSPFPLNYDSSSMLPSVPFNTDPVIASASTNEDFLKTIFSLNTEGISKAFLIGDKAVVCKLVEIINIDSTEKKSMADRYAGSVRGWSPYYTLSMITRQFPIGLAQSTVIDFILDNPKLTDYNLGRN